MSDLLFYRVDMPDADAPGRLFAEFIRKARHDLRWTQEDLLAHANISRRTLLRWEAGDVERPKLEEVRNLVLALKADPREAVVALGLVTREELDLPAAPIAFDPVLVEIQRHLSNEKLPERVRSALRETVRSARNMWLHATGLPAPKEPSAQQRRPRS